MLLELILLITTGASIAFAWELVPRGLAGRACTRLRDAPWFRVGGGAAADTQPQGRQES